MSLNDLTGDRLTEAEAAILRHDAWHANIDTRMGTFEGDMSRIGAKLDANGKKMDDTIRDTAAVKADTSELLTMFKSWKAAMQVASWLSKPISWLATTVAACIGAYAAWRATR